MPGDRQNCLVKVRFKGNQPNSSPSPNSLAIQLCNQLLLGNNLLEQCLISFKDFKFRHGPRSL